MRITSVQTINNNSAFKQRISSKMVEKFIKNEMTNEEIKEIFGKAIGDVDLDEISIDLEHGSVLRFTALDYLCQLPKTKEVVTRMRFWDEYPEKIKFWEIEDGKMGKYMKQNDPWDAYPR